MGVARRNGESQLPRRWDDRPHAMGGVLCSHVVPCGGTASAPIGGLYYVLCAMEQEPSKIRLRPLFQVNFGQSNKSHTTYPSQVPIVWNLS